jgi:hypothetical protein
MYNQALSSPLLILVSTNKRRNLLMDEQNKPLQFPLVAPVYTSNVRAGLRCVFFGLAQYLRQLPDDSKERELAFEALDTLVMRFQIGSGEEIRLDDNDIGQVLEAIGGFLLTLYNLQPPTERNTLHLFVTDWAARLKLQFTPRQ